MDAKKTAFDHLWGPLEPGQRLDGVRPRFAVELERLIDEDRDRRADSVSAWTFGQHVEHMYLVAHWVLDRIHESMESKRTDQRMNLVARGYFVFGLGWTPRGVYPTLAELVPKSGSREDILPLKDSLEHRLRELSWTWEEIAAHSGRSYHPWMTWLTTKQWFFFLERHNRHHRRILRDVARYARGAPGPARRVAQWTRYKLRNEVMITVLGTRRPTPPIEEGAATRARWLAGGAGVAEIGG